MAKIPIGNCISLSETYNQVGLPVSSNDAKIVSINKLICIMPPAKIAGKITIKNFLTPSFLKFNFGTGNLFMLFRGAICINSCTKPASNTPQANTKISISYFGATNHSLRFFSDLNILIHSHLSESMNF